MREPYSEQSRAEDTSKAVGTISATLFPNDQEPLAVDLYGSCPHCADELVNLRRWIVAVSPAAKINDRDRKRLAAELRTMGIDTSSGDETFELVCWCKDSHSGRPVGREGCGSRFTVRVRWPE